MDHFYFIILLKLIKLYKPLEGITSIPMDPQDMGTGMLNSMVSLPDRYGQVTVLYP